MRRMRLAALPLLMLPALGIQAAEPPATQGGVAVYRGPGSGPLPALPQPQAAPPAVAGKTLWRIDEDRGTAVACRMESTMMVGQRRLRCVRGRMPEP